MTETVSGPTGGASKPGKATKAGGTGLTIERVYTTQGVHPYDEVTWERRDVVQQNWKTGETVFEQRGVEFPESWSANASTIVTTKYFRGAVGTEQREQSLKQLLDRVVLTYVKAGKDNGYFATDADAEVFEHELTYMLLHQIFSFNSPVWFNVGTSSPQQVSACQPYDALVSTPAGMVPIGKLVEGDAVGTKVYDAHGVTQILATKSNGVKDVLRLHTKAGHALDVTADHLVWKSIGDDSGHFVEAGTLRAGDLLEWHRRDLEDAPAEVEQTDIVRIEKLGEMEVYDIQTESGEYLSSNLRVHNCFILAVDDSMDSILNWYKEEGLIFKGGSGAGLNLSRIRSSKELLRSSGGTASGPVSFMRGADASAGTIKSGGATRRAAKMVVLDVDHPDIEEFVETKAREEEKIRALRDAGYDMDLGGKDITSVQYQNANNSVRVTDEFMRAADEGTEFGLRARTTGEVIDTVDARKLWGDIAQAAWACADPGIQYDSTINDWHTTPETGRISASNPCFPADQRVVTDKGLVQIGDMVARSAQGEKFEIYTNDVTSKTDTAERVVATRPVRYMVTGTNQIIELGFSDGSSLRCTPNHRLWTANRGWVHAEDLTETDEVVRSFHYAGRPMASQALPSGAQSVARSATKLALPEKWSQDFGHVLGWLVGDGCVTDQMMTLIYGSEADRTDTMPRHAAALREWTNFEATPSVQANGTQQLRSGKHDVIDFVRALGVSSHRASGKVVPDAVFEAPEEALVAFLQGLFDADGCVVDDEVKGTRYVGLGSRSNELLRGVQELLASLGIAARVYETGTKKESFHYTRKDGSEATYGSNGPSYDLRITGRSLREFASRVGFTISAKSDRLRHVVEEHTFYAVDETVRMTGREQQGFETTYNLTEPRNQSYIVNGVVVSNCSEYMHLDNSSCNLASLNLLRFLQDDGSFDAKTFVKATELVITAMDISICFADFPTKAIGETTRAYRQLGIGYANLGALLMASGLAYDSDGGRALAGAITSLMTGTSYRRSAELAGVVGPYDGFAQNAEPHARVMRKHQAANDEIRTMHPIDVAVQREATKQWADNLKIGQKNGWRNAQASVIAPTGCLTADTMVTTDRGLARLGELGDVWGDRWQGLDAAISTDEGPQQATQFFVNGEEPTRRVATQGGYAIQGTLGHRIKVVDPESGAWAWKRMADVQPDDLVPMQLGTMVGEPREVPLPVLDQAYYAGDRNIEIPQSVTPELAELVGYFMGDGSLHAKGIRLCVADTDLDVVERLRVLSKDLFHLEPKVEGKQGYHEVVLQSVRLARWWDAAGFAKVRPGVDHTGKGWTPRIPSAVLETNDTEVYASFLGGLFEADGTVLEGVPSVATASEAFAAEVRTMLLALGMVTTTRETASGWGGPSYQVRLRNIDHALHFDETIGFLSNRKNGLMAGLESPQAGNRDRIHLPRELWNEIVPIGSEHRSVVISSLGKSGGVARQTVKQIYAETRDERLGHVLGYAFERVATNEDGGVQPTYDISVPENVTYVASGFVSHNTIAFMLDCDTTGIEPDFSLVKFKKLVGGGSMQIVNQAIPAALAKLGYTGETSEAIVEYIAEHGHVIDAPGLRPEHYEVFDCAMGERSIKPMGHVRMMAAAQPFVSGAISKTVNLPETATVEDIADVYHQGWKLGLKALAVYRDNCKVGQPLADAKAKRAAAKEPEVKIIEKPVRKRLPKSRPSMTTSFTVGGAEGYMTSGSYPDNGLGEVFLKLGKQGSTLAGVMDAFSIAISISLQYGVPLETFVSKFTNMKFEPSGLTDDPDVRMSQSIMDYIFRRLALDYLPFETRSAMGIYSAEERQRQLDTGSYEAPAAEEDETPEAESLVGGDVSAESPAVPVEAAAKPAPETAHTSAELLEEITGSAVDSPLCFTCGTKMRPAGSCHVCEGCGATSGCS